MRDFRHLKLFLYKYVEFHRNVSAAIFGEDLDEIRNFLTELEVNNYEIDSKGLRADEHFAVRHSWMFDILIYCPGETDCLTAQRMDFPEAVASTVRSIIIDVDAVEQIDTLLPLFDMLHERNFRCLPGAIIEGVGLCLLSRGVEPGIPSKLICESLKMSRLYSNLGNVDATNEILSCFHRLSQSVFYTTMLPSSREKYLRARHDLFVPAEEPCYDYPPVSVSFTEEAHLLEGPTIGILVIAASQPAWMLVDTIVSIIHQPYSQWAITIVAIKSEFMIAEHELLHIRSLSSRIRFKSVDDVAEIKGNVGRCFDEADFVTVASCGVIFSNGIFLDFYRHIARHPSSLRFTADVTDYKSDYESCIHQLGPDPSLSIIRAKPSVILSIYKMDAVTRRASWDEIKRATAHIPISACLMKTWPGQPEHQDTIFDFEEVPTHSSYSAVFQTPSGKSRVRWRDIRSLTSVICLTSSVDDAAHRAAERLKESVCSKYTEFVLAFDLKKDEYSGDASAGFREFNQTTERRIQSAVGLSRGEFLVFIDVAFRPKFPDCISELVGPIHDLGIGIVGGRISGRSGGYDSSGMTFDVNGNLVDIDGLNLPENFKSAFLTTSDYRFRSAVSGGAFAISRVLFDELGGFSSPWLFPRLDVDLCIRAVNASAKILYNPYASFLSFGQATLSDWLDCEQRGKIWLRKNFPAGDPLSNPKAVYRSASQMGVSGN